MFDLDIEKYSSYFSTYGELRLQKNKMAHIYLLNGDVANNGNYSSQGISVRLGKDGIWGFSSFPEISDAAIKKAFLNADDRFKWIAGKQKRKLLPFPANSYIQNHIVLPENTPWSLDKKLDFLRQLDSYLKTKYPELNTRAMILYNTLLKKNVITSTGSRFRISRPFYSLSISLTIMKNNEPTTLGLPLGGFGYLQDKLQNPQFYFNRIDELYESLMQKANGVYARPGLHDVILDADLAGILSHEAIGHTTEADFVLKGSIAGNLLHKKVASSLVTLKDIAHSFNEEICPVPIYIDDEATLAEDVNIIEDGILKNFMHDRSTAQKLNMKPQGNARANSFSDEPLIRMRNTMIMPGNSQLKDMIASIDNGYYLIKSSNGEADSTSEFMFGVVEGYEIKKGKITNAIKDTTISGLALDVLKSVNAVSREYKFSFGHCGKKQSILVGMGGPALRCKINIGGN